MTEPKHWLDESSDADDFERAILRSGSMADPTDAKREQVWAAVLGAASLTPLVAAAGGTEAAKTVVGGAGKAAAVWLGVGKGFVVGLAIYGAASGANAIVERLTPRAVPAARVPHVGSAPPPRTLPSAAANVAPPDVVAAAPAASASADAPSAPSRPPSGVGVSSAPRASSSTAELPAVATFAPAAAPTSSAARASQLRAEAAALSRAQAALRAGRLTDAFAELEASKRQFSAPELYQEREALLIELLSRTGQAAAAEQRAHAFLAEFPDSPHADQVKRFVSH